MSPLSASTDPRSLSELYSGVDSIVWTWPAVPARFGSVRYMEDPAVLRLFAGAIFVTIILFVLFSFYLYIAVQP